MLFFDSKPMKICFKVEEKITEISDLEKSYGANLKGTRAYFLDAENLEGDDPVPVRLYLRIKYDYEKRCNISLEDILVDNKILEYNNYESRNGYIVVNFDKCLERLERVYINNYVFDICYLLAMDIPNYLNSDGEYIEAYLEFNTHIFDKDSKIIKRMVKKLRKTLKRKCLV